MTDASRYPVTDLLVRWRQGDQDALDELLPLVYDEMRRIAGGCMQGERPSHTLQATALVHEAYARLVGMKVVFEDRIHFMAIAARTMRRILVEHARARGRQRRGGGWKRETLDSALVISPELDVDMLALDSALVRLETHDQRKSRAIELHYFGGMSYAEIASALAISEATVHRDLRMAKAWLHRELTA
jgi:RNA polymerase sigma factor (TIGR02999 family)